MYAFIVRAVIQDGGLYDKLYTALCFAVENLYTRPARQPRQA